MEVHICLNIDNSPVCPFLDSECLRWAWPILFVVDHLLLWFYKPILELQVSRTANVQVNRCPLSAEKKTISFLIDKLCTPLCHFHAGANHNAEVVQVLRNTAATISPTADGCNWVFFCYCQCSFSLFHPTLPESAFFLEYIFPCARSFGNCSDVKIFKKKTKKTIWHERFWQETFRTRVRPLSSVRFGSAERK